LAIGLGGLAIAVGIYTAAQWAMNSAILANPITWVVVGIVAAIAVLVAAGVAIYENWDTIKAKAGEVWNGIKEKFAGIKNTISTAWNDAKAKTSETINSIKTNVSNVFNGIKNTAVSVWNGIKTAITKPISSAWDLVSGVIKKLKNAFNFSWSLPKLNLPHISVKGGKAPFGIGGKGSLPSFSIEWYKNGGIMTNPTVFGVNPATGNLMAGGEAGPEAILPIDRLQGYISSAIDRTMQSNNLQALVNAVEDLANRAIELNINGRQFAVATAADTDNVSGNRYALTKRGLAL
jgi:phage-related minor tail protein